MKIKNIEKKLKNIRIRLGEILVRDGLVTEKELNNALAAQKVQEGRLGDILVSMKLVDDGQIAAALSKQLDIPLVRLEKTKISRDAVSLVPEALAEKYMLMPIRKQGKKLVVAMSNPLEYNAVQDLRFITDGPIYIVVASKTDVEACQRRYYPKSDISGELAGEVSADDMEVIPQKADEDMRISDLKNSAELPPVIRFGNSVIADAIRLNASDIHIEPQKLGDDKKVMVVRYRIDGIMHETLKSDISIHTPLVSRLKVISGLDISERRIPQDGKAQVNYNKTTFDLRVSTIPTTYGEKVTMRILNPASARMNPEDLGFTPKDLDKVLDAIHRPQGLVLVTGPTGSGKSSSLYAFLNRLNAPEVNIITVEDPVEFDVPGINQVQINTRAGITFAKGLRSILRQDPDIVMVGEIRDAETAAVAFQAAQTGHLVLSTLHTNDAPSAVCRLMDLGIDAFQISSALVAVIGQRLVRRIHRDCRIKETPDAKTLERISAHIPDAGGQGSGPPLFYRGGGCAGCNNTGYKGRMGLYEIMRMTPALRELIKPGISASAIAAQALKEGYKTLARDGVQKAVAHATSLSEVFRVAPPDPVARQAPKKTVPVTPEADAPPPTPPAPDVRDAAVFTPRVRIDFSGQGPRIVVAEDNDITQEVICDALESRGFQAIAADNGKEALEIILDAEPDLVITDYIMPEMDGLQLIRALKAREATRDIPILMLTSVDNVESELMVMKAGADEYLPKPIDRRKFLQRVESLARRIPNQLPPNTCG